MVQKASNGREDTKPAYMYYLMTKSGQCSPTSDTMDSGTGSDLETSPSQLDARKGSDSSLSNAVAKSIRRFGDLTIQKPNGQQHRNKNRSAESYNTDSEESESSLSCDSLNSSELLRLKNSRSSASSTASTTSPVPLSSSIFTSDENNVTKINFLPRSLLRDIRDHSLTLSKLPSGGRGDISRTADNKIIIKNHVSFSDDDRIESSSRSSSGKFSDCSSETASSVDSFADGSVSMSSTATLSSVRSFGESKVYENDKYYNFHINERVVDPMNEQRAAHFFREDDTFAGYRDISARVPASTIRSSKGTIRGVKNRVRNGIATFLQMQQTNVKVRRERRSNGLGKAHLTVSAKPVDWTPCAANFFSRSEPKREEKHFTVAARERFLTAARLVRAQQRMLERVRTRALIFSRSAGNCIAIPRCIAALCGLPSADGSLRSRRMQRALKWRIMAFAMGNY